MLTAGELIGLAVRLRRIQEELVGDGLRWVSRAELLAVACRIEEAAGARAVQELLAQSHGNAA